MFQFFKDPKFDFMGRRNTLLVASGLMVLASIAVLLVNGLNLGIEFAGGTELEIRYAQTPDLGRIRATLSSAGMTSQTVTTIGDPALNEVYIRLATDAGEDSTRDDVPTRVVEALGADQVAAQGADRIDLNIVDAQPIMRLLSQAPGLTPAQADELTQAILARRQEVAIIGSIDSLSDLPGMTPTIQTHLERGAYAGEFTVRRQSFIWPAIGEELQRKAGLAILGSLVGMLIYIWIRFQLQWGFAAVVALAHDTLLTLGLFSIFGKELSLPVVAAFLTLVGYSVNDTVVVFDRIRENVRKRTGTLEETINLSINQTLSRTIITSGLTLAVVVALLLFGGAALNPFSFVLTIGVIVGTYSSIYVASPILLLSRKVASARKQGQGAGRTRKVRTTA